MRGRNKFGAKKTLYGGRLYHSKREAAYARDLDLLVKGKVLSRWEAQVKFPLIVNDKKLCDYIIDFIEYDNDNNATYVEVKGFETDVWKLKWKLFSILYPTLEKRVVK